MSAHTPGPWLREGSFVYALMNDGFRRGEEQLKNRFYFQVNRDHADCSQEECEAVAALAQAAPDLLRALEVLLPMVAEWHEEFPRDVGDAEAPAIAAAHAAIAKATGASK